MSKMLSGEMYYINNQMVSKGAQPVTVMTTVSVNPEHHFMDGEAEAQNMR